MTFAIMKAELTQKQNKKAKLKMLKNKDNGNDCCYKKEL